MTPATQSIAPRLWLQACAVAGALAGHASGHGADATAVASARVIAPLTITATDPHLRFGAFATTAGGQAVTIQPDGNRIVIGAQAAALDQADPFGPARFVVQGEGGLSFSIALPKNVVLTTGAGASPREVMQVSEFRSEPSVRGILQGGSQTLVIGATLNTVRDQALGTYLGTFAVTVSYD